jgi:long-chain acyl-CoA synthetase
MRDLINNIAEEYGENIAFEIRRKIVRERYHYKDLPALIKRVNTFFKQLDIKEGERILIWGLNCPEYSILLLTCFSQNRVAVPIDYRNNSEMILSVIEQTNPRVGFVSKYLQSDFLDEHLEKKIYIEDLFNLISDLTETEFVSENDSKENIVEIVYTSGTTGIPKGVCLTEQNLLTNMYSLSQIVPYISRYETLSLLPLSHMFEQVIGLLMMLKMGGRVIYLPKINSFRILEALKENSVTHLIFVPQLFNIFLDKIKLQARELGKYSQFENALKISQYLPTFIRKILFKDVHKIFGKQLKFFGSGGAPLSKKTAEIWKLMGFEVLEGYGATEVTAVATMSTPSNKRIGSVGKTIPDVDIHIDTDKQVIIKSPSVSKGYYNNSEKTSLVFTNEGYKTGDIGYLDSDGYLYILGRDDFKIVLPSGEKIYAEDLEQKINSHPLVKDSCVIEISTKAGADILALFILDKNQNLDSDLKTIVDEVNLTLESKQQIRNYKEWNQEDFPRTHTLKIDRKKVKSMIGNEISKNEDIPDDNPVGNALSLLDILARLSGVRKEKIMDDDRLSRDLMLDSLSRVELVAQIEEFLGVIIEESQINSKTTVKELINIVEASPDTSVTDDLPSWQFTPFGRLVSHIINKFFLFPFHSTFIKIEVSGEENIKNLKGKGFIAAFNHPGILDGVCVLRVLKSNGYKNCFTLSWKGFWEDKVHKYIKFGLESMVGGMPLYDSGHKFIRLLQKSSDLLDSSYYMLYAPQGKLQKNKVQDTFKAGIGFVMKELNVPVVPIKIVGYEDIWPAPDKDLGKAGFKELLPKKRGNVKVIIGEPFTADKKGSALEIANILEEKFNKL